VLTSMSGYNIDRFVDLSESERDELTCSICQDILCCPRVAPCCLQMYCEQCINEWLHTNNTCPHDRKPLTNIELNRPPRALVNLLLNLKITCDNKANGCDEVVKLEDLAHHTLNCKFNITKCKVCLCTMDTDHNCVNTLLQLNKTARTEIMDLKQELYKIKQLTSTSDANEFYTFDYKSLKERLRTGKMRRDLEILKSDVKESMLSHVNTFVFNSIVETDNLYDMTGLLQKRMMKKLVNKAGTYICK
ncbi:unnamed protein product, partial [Oppiella nova]